MQKISSLCLTVLSFLFLLNCSGHQPSSQQTFLLQWPVKRARLTQKFKKSLFRAGRHEGIDLAARHGSPILAAHDATVIFAGRKYKGYGNMIILEEKPWATLYAHLHKIYVKQGQRVKRNSVIGTMGNTGKSRGTHLHFELIFRKKPVDPLLYLKR